MDNWSRLFALLTEEAALWRESQNKTEQQLSAWRLKEVTEEEAEGYLAEQERLQALILQKQAAEEELQAAIDAAAEKPSAQQQEQLKAAVQAREELRKLQEKLTAQVKEVQAGLRSFGEKQRGLIKAGRSRQAVQQSYQTVPVLEESALLDQKK